MKTGIFHIGLAAIILVTACTKGSEGASLSFEIVSDTAIELVTRAESRVSDYTTVPSASTFDIEIKSNTGELVWRGKLSEWKPDKKLKLGNYTASASFGNSDEEGVDKPYFYGESNFSISSDSEVTVKIPVKLANCIIKLGYSDKFIKYFTDYTITVTTGAGNKFTFNKNNEKPIFVNAYKFIVECSLTGQGGNVSNIPARQYDQVEPACCYTLEFDASDTNGLKVDVSFNNDVTTIDLGTFEMN